ncbi:MAG: carbohydrate kinase family protein [Chloroflexi bacterium]|nr:carbohydrate kinase family protein [Chloroflexota bacterium]
MDDFPPPRFLIAGEIKRNYILTPRGEPVLDEPGGSLLYAAAGLAVWEKGIGLIGKVGADFPQAWLDKLVQYGFDCRGIHILPEQVDQRYFAAYTSSWECQIENPVAQFAQSGHPFPKDLLGYNPPPHRLDSRTRLGPLSLRGGDIPSDYLDAAAAHLCPLDYLAGHLIPPYLRQGHITTLTVDPSPGYMDPVFWDDMPVIIGGLSAFLTSEKKLTRLFEGRSIDLWEMADGLAKYGCELVVIKRGAQGQYLFDAGNRTRWIVPAYPVNVYDPTGAGDAFCGGFLAGWRNTYDPLQACLQGNISASLVVESSGVFYPCDTLPGLAQVRVQALKQMVQRA